MTQTTLYRWSIALLLSLCSLLLSAAPQSVHAQSATVNVSGIITDAKGGVLQNTTISIKNETTGNVRSVKVDAQGHVSLGGIAPGRYTIEVSAPGFGLNRRTVQLAAGQDQDISVALAVGDVSQQVTVEANSVGSIASALAPMDALLEARSARTYISPTFIQNFTSPDLVLSRSMPVKPTVTHRFF